MPVNISLPSQRLMGMTLIVGVTLIVGAALFLVGATLYAFVKDPRGPVIFGQPPNVWLRLIYEHQAMWLWATILFIVGTLVTLLGLGSLTTVLRADGDPVFSQLGLLAFAIGATLWMISLAARLTVQPWAAKEMATTHVIPDSYTPLMLLSTGLWVIYTILAFVALALYGAAIVSTSLLPHWLGWATIVYGIAGLIFLAVTRDAPPFLHYLPPIAIGVFLLLM